MSMNVELTNTEYLILDAVSEAKKGLRPPQIKEICNISDPTLHKYLKKLVDKNYLLKKQIINKEYPHPVVYILNKNNKEIQLLLDLPEEYRKGSVSLKISRRYAELDIAKEIIEECGIKADAEIKKRYHKRYGLKKEETGETFTFHLPPKRSELELKDDEKDD